MGMETISKIENILGRIRIHPEYSSSINSKTLQRLREEADRHSLALEAESGELNGKEIEIFKQQSYQRMINMRYFLAKEGLTPYSLSCLGNLLEPERNPVKNFRTREVNFGEFVGTEPGSIIFEIKELTDRLNDVSLHPINRACDAHISLLKTHPYFDGNGRAARLIQDVCLESRGYPSGIIPCTDRELYIHLMNAALRDRFKGKSNIYQPSENECLLQDFIESKILASTEILEEELKKRRYYVLVFGKIGSPSLTIKLKHLLAGNSSTSNPLSVQLKSKKTDKQAKFYVLGDVCYEDISSRARDLAKKYDLKYNCKSHQGCLED